MASSSSSTGLTSTGGLNGLGIVGLNSGMDTTSIIQKMMQYDKAPLNQFNQQIQTLQWEATAYQTINTSMASLKDTVSALELQASYNTKSLTNSNNQMVAATAATNAVNGTYTINVTQAATYAYNNSSTNALFPSQIIGTSISKVDISDAQDHFQITVDGQAVDVDLSTLDGKEYTVTGSGNNDSLNDLANAIQDQIAKTTFDNGTVVKVQVTSNNQLDFYTTDGASHNIVLNDSTDNTVLGKLGYTDGAKVTGADTQDSLFLIQSQFTTDGSTFLNNKQQSDKFSFSINGCNFTDLTYGGTTIDSLISQINSSSAGVNAYFDSNTGKLMLTATKSGDYNNGNPGIMITDNDGVLSNLFHITQSTKGDYDNNSATPDTYPAGAVGTNAQFSINGTSFSQASNSVTLKGVTFNITGTGSSAVTVSTNTEDISKKIGDFVTAYNKVLSDMYTQINQKRPTKNDNYYDPLTDDQKSSMSDTEITQWNTLAQQGLLNNDSILLDITNNMRGEMSQAVYNPLTISGATLTGSVTLTDTSNQFTFTVGSDTEQITLDAGTYTADQLKVALQQKLDNTFGTNRVQVSADTMIKGKQLTFTTNNVAMSFSNGTKNNGLNLLGLNSGQSVSASYSTLSQIGITTGDYSENGALHLDTTKLANALESDPDAVMRLLTKNATASLPVTASNSDKQKAAITDGIFVQLFNTLSDSVGRLTDQAGVANSDYSNSTVGKQISNDQTQASDIQDRLDAEESRYWTMFNNMETALSTLNSQMSMITSMLGN